MGQGAQFAPSVDHAANPMAARLPWFVGLGALLILIVVISLQSAGGDAKTGATVIADASTPAAPPMAGGGDASAGTPPNIANMSANERASRLYNRIMAYAEAGKTDSVAFFAPMALASHAMLERPSLDERYHYGRIGEVTGDLSIARAEADTILASEPNSLLGLMLAGRAARLANDKAGAAKYDKQLLSVVQSELARKLPDYEVHRSEIDRAVADARGSK